jgi:hypothetical protein
MSLQQHSDTRAFTGALVSGGPAPEHAAGLMLYGQFIGEWELDWIGYADEGPATSARGEWIFSWVLEGRAVQDVWILPHRDEGAPAGEYGTTIRFYDPRSDVWYVTWSGPVNAARRTFVARNVGEEIVQEGTNERGELLKWIFSEITPGSFRWRNERSADGGASWRLVEEMRVRRRSYS